MNGFLMNFFKYVAADTEDFEETDRMYMNAHEGGKFVRSVVWSAFDRLEIRPIKYFDEFRLSQYSEKKWVGERQFALLYEISNGKKRLEYKKSDDKCKFAFHKVYDKSLTLLEKDRDELKYRFFGISMVDLTPEVHNDFFGSEDSGYRLYDSILHILNELQSKNNIADDSICYDIYGTLGGSDLAIIWLANEFRDVITIIEAMRKSKIRNSNRSFLANIYTIMGIRDINNKNVSYESVDGKLNIRLTKKGTYEHDNFIEALKKFIKYDGENKNPIDTTLGEHDISIRVDGIELIKKLYTDDGFIHIRNEDFFNNIIQANTELAVNIDYDKIKSIKYNCTNRKFRRTIISLKEKNRVYENIEFITKNKLFDELPYLKETLWILYEDYLKNISSTFSYPWIGDLHFQFSQSILYLKDLVETEDTKYAKDKKYEIIRRMIGTMRQTLLHVSQANRLFFEIPSTHLKNTGSYSKILRTYYGVVKQLLLQAYAIPKKEFQAAIVPFITFDVIPKIISSKLPQLPNNESIIVNIVLPYEALVDIPKYAKLLAHEVFHYVAPRNRVDRNKEIGVISISLFLTEILKKYTEYIWIDKQSNYKELYVSLERCCLEYVVNQYEELTKKSERYVNDIWDKYFDSLDSYFARNSLTFAYMNKVHKGLFSIIESILEQAKTEKNLPINVREDAKDILGKITFNDFGEWIRNGAYRNVTDVNLGIKYALREAMADYFMIQVMNCTTNIADYYSLNLRYKDLLETKSGGIDYRQEIRIAIITDIVFDEITCEIDKSNIKETLSRRLYTELKDKAQLSDDKIKKVIFCYGRYYEMFRQYRPIIKLYLKSLQFNNIINKKFGDILEKTVELFQENGKDDFSKSIQYIEHFQVQNELENLNSNLGIEVGKDTNILENLKNLLKIQTSNSVMKEYTYLYANSVTELIDCIDRAINKITDRDVFDPIWFRGHSSYEYKLIPSLYRIKSKKGDFFKNVKLREVINPLFKSFKVKAFGSREIYERGDDSRIGILASMQHYSVPTNILDWTPAAFVALYFAVEKYMVYNEQDKQQRETPKVDAELWILNPGRLNQARDILTGRKIDVAGEMYPIPSIYDEDEDYKEYIPFSSQENPYNLPVAVYVPHVNQRIKAQLGTFTMFSLDATPYEKGEEVYFEDMIDLQNKYYKKDEAYKPFLASVRLSKKCVLEVADWLRSIGVTKPTVYPELNSISETLTGEIKDYCFRKEKKT